MKKSLWLRKLLMGGIAFSALASVAHADELSDLKAQLAALQSEVDQMKVEQSSSSFGGLTLERGQGTLANWGNGVRSDAANVSSDNGFTIAITPTADMPAPVAELVVYGYVKGDVIYDQKGIPNRDSFELPSSDDASDLGNGNDYTYLHARQSRFGIKSKVDTAVGQIRTRIEGDFFGSDRNAFRMRHAYGEWDMTPNWTLLVGQTDRTGKLAPIGITLVDFFGPYGFGGVPRTPQVRVTYHDGPLSWAVAIERPYLQGDWEEVSSVAAGSHHDTNSVNPVDGNYKTALPNLATYIQYDVAGGHQVILAATLADLSEHPNMDIATAPAVDVVNHADLGWHVSAGANINLADMATLTAGGIYTQGLTAYVNGLRSDVLAINGKLQAAYGVHVGVIFNVSETTTVNVGWSYAKNVQDNYSNVDNLHVVSGNVLWQPVKQIRLGWEAQWGRNKLDNALANGKTHFNDLRFQFGTWFFF